MQAPIHGTRERIMCIKDGETMSRGQKTVHEWRTVMITSGRWSHVRQIKLDLHCVWKERLLLLRLLQLQHLHQLQQHHLMQEWYQMKCQAGGKNQTVQLVINMIQILTQPHCRPAATNAYPPGPQQTKYHWNQTTSAGASTLAWVHVNQINMRVTNQATEQLTALLARGRRDLADMN